jgi:hypothetical protein
VLPGVFLTPMQPSVDRWLQRVGREAVAAAPAAETPAHTVAARQDAAPSAARVKH